MLSRIVLAAAVFGALAGCAGGDGDRPSAREAAIASCQQRQIPDAEMPRCIEETEASLIRTTLPPVREPRPRQPPPQRPR